MSACTNLSDYIFCVWVFKWVTESSRVWKSTKEFIFLWSISALERNKISSPSALLDNHTTGQHLCHNPWLQLGEAPRAPKFYVLHVTRSLYECKHAIFNLICPSTNCMQCSAGLATAQTLLYQTCVPLLYEISTLCGPREENFNKLAKKGEEKCCQKRGAYLKKLKFPVLIDLETT